MARRVAPGVPLVRLFSSWLRAGASRDPDPQPSAGAVGLRRPVEHPVHVPASGAVLDGELSVPAQARGLVVFARGSGSCCRSPLDRALARSLQRARIGTMLFDLLRADEEALDRLTAELRFDVDRLARRLGEALAMLQSSDETAGLPLGLSGQGTGAAAALVAAAQHPDVVRAVVCRGARIESAREALPMVRAPTLLLVGASDEAGLEESRALMPLLACEKKLVVVPRAGPQFEEPGVIDVVARHAIAFFERHLASDPPRPAAGA